MMTPIASAPGIPKRKLQEGHRFGAVAVLSSDELSIKTPILIDLNILKGWSLPRKVKKFDTQCVFYRPKFGKRMRFEPSKTE